MKKRFLPKVLLFLFVAAGVFVGTQYVTGTGLFKKPGIVIYEESVTEAEKTFLSQYLEAEEVWLDHDVTISAEFSLSPLDQPTALLYDVLVPIADFYESSSTIASTNPNLQLVSINSLTFNQKLLALDDQYYFDHFDAGAFFRYFHITSADSTQAIELIQPHLSTFPTKDTVLSFAQTGVTAFSRRMNTMINSTGPDYFAAKIKDFLNSKDLTHLSNEASFHPSAPTNPAGTVICSKPAFIDAITAVGADIIELTGNHNNDCGFQANLDTLTKYQELGIRTVGGGANAEEAAKPLLINEKNQNITLLAYNQSTGGTTTGNRPGANAYSEAKVTADITAAKARGDFVIVDIQYYECYCYPNGYVEYPPCDRATWGYNQQGFFREIIDLGADVVVGTQAHQPQTYELYGNGVIYYGLGNLFFDQYMWPGTSRGLILTHYFYNNQLVQTRLSPTVFDKALQVRLMNEQESAWLLKRLSQAR